jgi:predicted RNase H-like nuclease
MKCLGIDFGWQSQPRGLCCLEWQQGSMRLRDLCRLSEVSEILDWVDRWAEQSEPAIVAVDAPTLIPNPTGMRLPDRLTHQHFGRYHAGCYPANLGRPFASRTVALGLSLEARGFVHAPVLTPQHLGRYQIEVFPHPATVHLFGLERILKYKKGKVADRRRELVKLRDYILTVLPRLNPPLVLAETEFTDSLQREVPFTSLGLKALEDQLDSLICAYVAGHWWHWGLNRNWVLGADTPEESCTTGYIVVPAPYESTPGGTVDEPPTLPQ